MVDWFIKGGIVMIPLLLCSIAVLAIFIERCWSLRILFRQGKALIASERPVKERERLAARLVRSMQWGLPVFETIVVIAPMLGLLGTILGIIHSFEALSAGATAFTKSNLGAGLAEALITTEAGLMIAIPTQVIYNIFRGRINRFIDECNDQLAEEKDGVESC